MAKIALLIGVSEYGPGLSPLPGAQTDVEAVQRVLQPLEMGGFDEVKQLCNPNPPVMREAIESLFSGRTQDDLVVLFFSGHLVWDDSGKFYFATTITRKSPRADLIRVSAVPTSFVHNVMSNSSCQRQVVILDGCVSPISTQEMAVDAHSTANIQTQLVSEKGVILSCFTSTENSLEPNISSHSVYTQYLVEGIQTGAADINNDGWISLDELHQYATNKVKIAAPALKPELYSVEDKAQILLSQAPLDHPKLKYRKVAESWVTGGEISQVGRSRLSQLATSLGLISDDCTLIEAEVLKPYRDYQAKLQQYKRQLAKVICHNYPLDTQEREELRGFQQCLGLREEDVAPIEEQMVLKLANLHQSEDKTPKLTPSDSQSQPNTVPATANTVLQQSTRLLPVEPTNPNAESPDEGDTLAPLDSQSQPNTVPATANTVLQQSTRLLPVEPTNPNPESQDEVDTLAPLDSQSQPNTVPATANTVLQQSTRLLPVEPTHPNPAVNLSSSSVAGDKSSSSSVFTFPYKFLLPLGIGGVLLTVALAVGLSTRKPGELPTNPAQRALSSANSSPQSSPRAKNSDKELSPSPSASPKSKTCTIFVNGNLRSNPISLQSEVVESLRESIPVTGKRTDDGWVQVRLPSGKLAWAHPGIISSQSEREMEACLARKKESH
ncbi:caspase family protein [Allocoleopsis sp.]|uniref:caspase family protein n=1 Tax=Allocoleopsis sp. TaxID=3088169 RepID=UPI002FD12DD5